MMTLATHYNSGGYWMNVVLWLQMEVLDMGRSAIDGLPHRFEEFGVAHVDLAQLVEQLHELLVLLEHLLQNLHSGRRLLQVQELRVHIQCQ